MQHLQRPLTLKLASNYTFEELLVITDEFFNKIENNQRSEDSLNVFVKMEEISAPNCGVRQLNCVRYSIKADQNGHFTFHSYISQMQKG